MALHDQHLQAIVSSCTTTLGQVPQEVTEKLLSWLADGTQGLCLFRPDDSVAYASPTFAQAWHMQEGQRTFGDIYRHCHKERVGPVIETANIEAWLELVDSKRRSAKERSFEIDMLDGKWFWAVETTFDGGWLLVTVTDITPLKVNEKSLRLARDAAMHWAETDSLTSLYNRRHAVRRASELLSGGHLLSLALLDLDHFKSINDKYGHDVGDLVLQNFSARALESVRTNDVLARVGGEEFLLLMPGTQLGLASEILSTLRSAISTDTETPRYTFSAGLIRSLPGETFEALYARVDRVLYLAKSSGRDRTAIDPATDHQKASP